MGKTVHVTSSNIKLSIRDYEDSYKYFRLLKISSAILVHSNELPTAVRKNLKIKAMEEMEKVKIKQENKNKNKEKNKKDVKNKDENKSKDENNDKDKNKEKEKDKDEDKSKDKDDSEDNDNISNNNNDKSTIDDYSDDNYSSDSDDFSEENNKFETEYIDNLSSTNDGELKKDEYFGDNADKYYEYCTNAIGSSANKYYKLKYYHPDLFKNSSRMNFSVCGLNDQGEESNNKAQVIFSTFVNFECFYLKMVELCPASVESEFSKCSLLVDEADSILIDEIANGTIVSRSMKSNAKEILEYVYDNKMNGISAEDTFNYIKKHEKWKICHDLQLCDIEQMYQDIDLVNENEYKNGKKYSIEDIIVRNPKKKNMLLKKTLELSKEFGKNLLAGFIKEFTKEPNEEGEEDEDEDDDDDDDDDEGDEDDENEENDDKFNDQEGPITVFKHIVPFGYDRNGLLEPNKEFNRFIQQFIAIKESKVKENKNMIINDISMSYLYVSHPIFVKLYGTVCGFTGTIGDKSDKKLIKNEYGLSTLKVPRNAPNQRVVFPMVLCKNVKERNLRVIFEIVEFHKKGNPVLAIFQDLKEIEKIEKKLSKLNIRCINIFDGKDENMKPDEIAGLRGAVSLGTNSCGRGTNIKTRDLPLHVIITYYSSNKRVMDQAFGRTARQGKRGTCRIICLEEQFFQPKDVLSDVDGTINEFSIKNRRQREFVDHYKSRLKWLFSNFPEKQKIKNIYLKDLKETKINVNRIVAYNYEFPLCMSRSTFIKIQVQKIFSLFNCPNSKFTWTLFQRYYRELILESWSLMVNELDIEFMNKPKDKAFENALQLKLTF